MKKYLRIMRLDHWIKQLFILPGCLVAWITHQTCPVDTLLWHLALGLLATSLIASANYVINEWLDASHDRYHPTKRHRTVVAQGVRGGIVWAQWAVLTLAGLALGAPLGWPFVVCLVWLWAMGIAYNVRPLRTKDVPLLDVLSESVNNAIRLLLGWCLVSDTHLPPCSIILGYWMAGAYLMAIKRLAEYRMIGDPAQAALYRRSFAHYSQVSLLVSALFYGMLSVFFIGIFLIKYRIELVLFMPLLLGLYCYYLSLAYQPDSCVQRPEKLYRERGLLLYCLLLAVVLVVLMLVDIPWLSIFTTNELIPLAL